MKINLNHLKFHSFRVDKKLHNRFSKQKSKEDFTTYFDKLLFDQKANSLQNILVKINNLQNPNELSKVLLKCHAIEEDKKCILINKIIKKCHKTLYEELQQFFENENPNEDLIKKAEIWQCKMINKERLFFLVFSKMSFKNTQKPKTFIPLIFDINHLLFRSEGHDNNISKKTLCDWDKKSEQSEIKKQLMQLL